MRTMEKPIVVEELTEALLEVDSGVQGEVSVASAVALQAVAAADLTSVVATSAVAEVAAIGKSLDSRKSNFFSLKSII